MKPIEDASFQSAYLVLTHRALKGRGWQGALLTGIFFLTCNKTFLLINNGDRHIYGAQPGFGMKYIGLTGNKSSKFVILFVANEKGDSFNNRDLNEQSYEFFLSHQGGGADKKWNSSYTTFSLLSACVPYQTHLQKGQLDAGSVALHLNGLFTPSFSLASWLFSIMMSSLITGWDCAVRKKKL